MTHPSTSYFILKRIWSLTPFLLNTDLKKPEGQTNPQKQHAQIRTNRFTLTKIKLTRQYHSSPAIAGSRTECPISTLPCDKATLNTKSQNPVLVEADGFEPTTPCLQSRCSPS